MKVSLGLTSSFRGPPSQNGKGSVRVSRIYSLTLSVEPRVWRFVLSEVVASDLGCWGPSDSELGSEKAAFEIEGKLSREAYSHSTPIQSFAIERHKLDLGDLQIVSLAREVCPAALCAFAKRGTVPVFRATESSVTCARLARVAPMPPSDSELGSEKAAFEIEEKLSRVAYSHSTPIFDRQYADTVVRD